MEANAIYVATTEYRLEMWCSSNCMIIHYHKFNIKNVYVVLCTGAQLIDCSLASDHTYITAFTKKYLPE